MHRVPLEVRLYPHCNITSSLRFVAGIRLCPNDGLAGRRLTDITTIRSAHPVQHHHTLLTLITLMKPLRCGKAGDLALRGRVGDVDPTG